jgi:GntR family transcriptional regulator/MocR family aminotransferase
VGARGQDRPGPPAGRRSRTFAELLTSGGYERHIRRNRTRYRRRRDLLLELLAGHLPEAVVRGEAAGLHVLVDTPTVAAEADVIAAAARHGLLLSDLGAHRSAPGPAGFVLAYAHLGHEQLRRGVRILASAVRVTS